MEKKPDRKERKEKIGKVISDRMDKTRVVVIENIIKHPKYRKYIRRRKKIYVHDEENKTHVGDVVRVMETRPLSKLKRWRIVEIVRAAERA